MPKRYKGRRRRPTRNPAVAAVARPAVVIAAAAAVSFGVMAPAQAHTGEHTVRSGDTLSKLAAGHGASWRTVYADNRDTIGPNPNVLRIGQVLTIGGSSSTPSAPNRSGGYVVRAGDTLGKIAARHGTTWQQLHAINREVIGANPNVLRVGQRLVISGTAAPAPAPAPTAAPERASRASERPAVGVAAVPASAPSGRPTPTSSSYGMWDPHVRPAVHEVTARFDVSTVVTRPGHSPTQGRAADFMVHSDRAKGDAIAQYVIDNAARLGVESVIWRQRIAGPWTGWAWRAMEDRGSPTANHMDHPHVAFLPAG
ncbi:LysM peptidoglycan-binding domain-containing protein [Geodermatophilus sp. DF01-2]|uniref:LysM peptidoglycan-binding domain-containing protein n=1 Tax=Geodermatophilus sp. DF01-2 TaxID=2559610 RepID=UPI0010735A01|nr:LysM domain-containing protein [Geodermatophilus sp. DF01_2]TFV62054.1 LysM peptidoglycan-binding domain-containing protein [Geodermatophilus sp. DF01_2]